LRDLDAEFEQLAVDPWCSPEGIGPRHPAYELPNFGGDCRSPGTSPSTFPGPVQPEALPMPSNDGVQFHQRQGVGPIVPDLGQQNPKDSIRSSLGEDA
jgi:hypothetical protein